MSTRREFLEFAAASVMTTAFAQQTFAEKKIPSQSRTLGRTGEKVSAIGMGGYHLARPGVDSKESIRIVKSTDSAGMSNRTMNISLGRGMNIRSG